ncbi:hypothetical protein [Colwellia sp. E150_009]
MSKVFSRWFRFLRNVECDNYWVELPLRCSDKTPNSIYFDIRNVKEILYEINGSNFLPASNIDDLFDFCSVIKDNGLISFDGRTAKINLIKDNETVFASLRLKIIKKGVAKFYMEGN